MNDEKKEFELKACPFCGHVPSPHRLTKTAIDEVRHLDLGKDCELSGMIFSFEAWNTRHPQGLPLDEECPSDLMEILANIEHERWSGWMKHQFKNGRFDEKSIGEWIMPVERVAHWQRLMNTPYSELSEHSKEMDRAEVRKTWKAICSKFSLPPGQLVPLDEEEIFEFLSQFNDGLKETWKLDDKEKRFLLPSERRLLAQQFYHRFGTPRANNEKIPLPNL